MTVFSSTPKAKHYFSIGVGFREKCSYQELEALILSGMARANLETTSIGALATVSSTAKCQLTQEVAARFGWETRFYTAENLTEYCDLHQDALSHYSVHAMNRMGTPSVSEASALLSASSCYGEEAVCLVLPIQRSANATLAIAGLKPSNHD